MYNQIHVNYHPNYTSSIENGYNNMNANNSNNNNNNIIASSSNQTSQNYSTSTYNE
jgi:hypothetical protein